MTRAPRIYSLARSQSGMASNAGLLPAEIAAWGFSAVHLSPAGRAAVKVVTDHGLEVLTDIFPDRSRSIPSLMRHLEDWIRSLLDQGVSAICCRHAHEIPAASWRPLLRALKAAQPKAWFCAEALGRPTDDLWSLQGAGFDYLFSSVGWWNGLDRWFFDQQVIYQHVARSIGFPLCGPDASAHDRLHRYRLAAFLSAGVLLHAGDEAGITGEITEINRLKAEKEIFNEDGGLRRFTGCESAVAGFVRLGASGKNPIVVAVNQTDGGAAIDWDAALAAAPPEVADMREITPGASQELLLPHLEIPPRGCRLFEGVGDLGTREPDPPEAPEGRPPSRVLIEHVRPELDGGLFPVKRIAGDQLRVTADLLRDGHDKIAAALRLRQFGELEWTVVPFRLIENDRWGGGVPLTRVGEARFVIEAWTDSFASWCDAVRKRREAGQAVRLELAEGRSFVEAASKRATGLMRSRLRACLARLDDPGLEEGERFDLLLSGLLRLWMARVPDKSDATYSPPRAVTVDRAAARFSAWYEMFPRSQGADPTRSATFADCVRRFPAVRELGFDVVYFVPIHPIGEVNRKGRNNRPDALPGDPGSPYAIGSRAGGHTAVDPGLGTLDDFRDLMRAARREGLEIALDFAVQCAPDHPWLKEHPGWFRRRADGSIKYAENPPKKYEDIVNVDFDQSDWRGLWGALRATAQFWIDEGVRIFRVDNPHTKPLVFWHWLIESIHQTHPDVLFTAEAFTRPKMMRRLAKEGFSQSYTYFTWRTTKAELTEYLIELTRSESVEYFRPNFFPTTPDILPAHLKTGGRAAFRSRLVLAATLSSSYGIYNGYELCEAGGLPDGEEYRDSEKYQFKAWDWDRPGHIKDDIARLNRLRRSSPALQLFDNLQFHPSSHPAVLFYSKSSPDGRDRVAVAVTVEPHAPVQTEIVFPFSDWNLPPGGRLETEELFSGWRQEWIGDRHVITLNPAEQPALVWKVL